MTREATLPDVRSEYLRTGGLQMYCETQGRGRPLLPLYAGLATIETSFQKLRPVLAKRWMAIAVEQQGHGHTADIDRQLAHDAFVLKDRAAIEALIADDFHFSRRDRDGARVADRRHGGLFRLGSTAQGGHRWLCFKHKYTVLPHPMNGQTS